jgi:hypothetical protein
MVREDAEPDREAHLALIDLRNHGEFLQVLEALNCSLALSRRPSGVALLGDINIKASISDGFRQTGPTLVAAVTPTGVGGYISYGQSDRRLR